MKQETLEEASEIYASHSLKEERQKDLNMGFKAGAKWQAERMYTEEDMKSFGEFCADYDYRCFGKHTQEEMLKIWFEQFKKK
jgi:hypothetical protein